MVISVEKPAPFNENDQEMEPFRAFAADSIFTRKALKLNMANEVGLVLNFAERLASAIRFFLGCNTKLSMGS